MPKCSASLALFFVLVLSLATPSTEAQTFSVLYSFTGGTDGSSPVGKLVRDAKGNLYGTTCCGFGATFGNVWKLDRGGKLTVLYSFTGAQDGGAPEASVIGDGAGNLYGPTYAGGDLTCPDGVGRGCGVVFKVNKKGKENEMVLHAFTGAPADGEGPFSELVRDHAGNLYGSAGGGVNDHGAVFRIDKSGTLTLLYSFAGGTDGELPRGLVRDSEGDLYGITTHGGGNACFSQDTGWGTVFKLDPIGNEAVLHRFTGGADGGYCDYGHGDIVNAGGYVYGAAYYGGDLTCSTYGCGVIWKVNKKTGKEIVLHTFTGGTDGSTPVSGVTRDKAGNLYGTTSGGGANGWGTVFKLDLSGALTVLHNFTSQESGPDAALVLDSEGNLYGTTTGGGQFGQGMVFKIAP